MAKHSKGKHAATRAELKDKARRDKLKAEGADQAPEATEDAPGSPDPEVSQETAALEDASAFEADDLRADTEEPTQAVQEPVGAKAKKGSKKAQHKPTSKRTIARRLGITLGVVAGVVAVAYLGGALLFATHFFPNTNISTVDISLDSPYDAAKKLDAKVGDYSIKLKGQGLNLSITSEQAGMALDSPSVTDAVLQEQNPWTWPAQIFEEHDVTAALAEAMSATGLSQVVEQAVADVNAKAEPPVDAAVVFKDEVGKFYIVPESEGTMLDPEKVLERTLEGVLNLNKDIVIKKDERLDPKILSTDERLVEACAKANQLARADITFTLDGAPAANVNATTIGQWVTVTPEFEVLFNNDELALWAEGIGDQFNTIGSERVYTRPDGKEVSVSGGSYGWKVDGEALEAAAIEAVQNGTIGTVEIPVLQSGHGFTALGAQDWGLRYVDVDLSEQYARFYDDEGNLVWESDIVSGARGKTDSPTGVYTLNHKQSPTVLIGEMTSEGTPEYESKVSYWMPFKGNSVGLHDATWQSAFGGQRYAQGFGSHGCINLPLSAAEALYGMIEPGDVVVVHY